MFGVPLALDCNYPFPSGEQRFK